MSPGPAVAEAVVFVHGIWRRARSLNRLARALQRAGYLVLNESYHSVTHDIPEAAAIIWRRIEWLQAPRVHFVTHSMGGLIVRHLLGAHPVPSLGHVVMIAPPSRGAALADHYSHFPFFRWLLGRSGLQLRSGDLGLGASLPPPPCPFAIFAGRRGTPRGWHPLIPGDDDGTVGVREAWLPGAAAFITVLAGHSFIMNHPEVIRGTVEFLQSGQITLCGSGGEAVVTPACR